MRETGSFINEGYGWTCKRCRAAGGTEIEAETPKALPRFFREGEAEERDARLSSPALARWKDASRRTLVCPRCGVEEDAP
jgi:hypothetical protein